MAVRRHRLLMPKRQAAPTRCRKRLVGADQVSSLRRLDAGAAPAARAVAQTLPDDELLHVCVLTYASDMTLLDTVLLNHGLAWGDKRTMGASLDHAMWFHRPFRADEWLLYDQASPSASGARGLAFGRLFTEDGTLVASGLRRDTRGPLVAAPVTLPVESTSVSSRRTWWRCPTGMVRRAAMPPQPMRPSRIVSLPNAWAARAMARR